MVVIYTTDVTVCNLLLLGNTDSLTAATSGLGVLSTDLDTPIVTETSVGTDLLKTLDILTELVVETVGKELGELTICDVLLSVKEPVGDLVLARVLDNGDDLVNLLLGQLSGALGNIDISLLASKGGESTANTLDGAEGNGDALTAINVRVQHTKNVGETLLIPDERLRTQKKKNLA
jgi:hypothetical protein